MKIVLAGGSGALGRRLAAAAIERGDEVVVLTRTHQPDRAYRQVLWDGKTVGSWVDELNDAVLINLAGELVDRRPTPSNIALLTRSRVEPTAALVAAASRADEPPRSAGQTPRCRLPIPLSRPPRSAHFPASAAGDPHPRLTAHRGHPTRRS
jgi:NAD dependent epimerase/dehydratase family enzyme